MAGRATCAWLGGQAPLDVLSAAAGRGWMRRARPGAAGCAGLGRAQLPPPWPRSPFAVPAGAASGR